MQLLRTQIELSVEEGTLTDEEVKAILEGLVPATPEPGWAVCQAPFHRLSYWARYRIHPPEVPHGLWRYRHPHRYDHSRIVSLEELRRHGPIRLFVPQGGPFEFDSAVFIEDPEIQHREMELIYRHRSNRSDHLWILAVNRGPLAPLLPPQPDEQAAEVREGRALRGTTVWYAALTERYGAWEAHWEEGGVRYAVWASASQFGAGDRFLEGIASES